ncbi:hypothetical protein ACEPAG_2260 [Sanghuangporus baumii]
MPFYTVEDLQVGEKTMFNSITKLYELAWGGDLAKVFVRESFRVNKHERDVTVLTWLSDTRKTPVLLYYFRVAALYVRDELQDMLMDNPFKQNLPRLVTRGVCITGSPGIGKSVSLLYILVLRLLCKLPTALMIDDTGVFFIDVKGVQFINIERLRNEALLPRGTWFLVDCRGKLRSVPSDILTAVSFCEGFIVHAASARAPNLDWLTKVDRSIPPQLYMDLWSMDDLIIARNFQCRLWDELPDERTMRHFVEKYGSTPRFVYGSSNYNDRYDMLVKQKIVSLDMYKLNHLLFGAPGNFAGLDPEVSNLFIRTFPSKGNRRVATRGVPTRYLTERLYSLFSSRQADAARSLYKLFVANGFTKASAGFLLERLFVDEFPLGGEWAMTRMNEEFDDEKTFWRFDAGSPAEYLRIGYQRKLVDIEDQKVPEDTTYSSLPTAHFAMGEIKTLDEKFYVPVPRSSPSVDALIYEKGSKVATLFQVTVGKRHDLKVTKLSWLKGLGAQHLDVVVVTCPLKGDMIWVAWRHSS